MPLSGCLLKACLKQAHPSASLELVKLDVNLAHASRCHARPQFHRTGGHLGVDFACIGLSCGIEHKVDERGRQSASRHHENPARPSSTAPGCGVAASLSASRQTAGSVGLEPAFATAVRFCRC
jgi:hypothetical protein